MATIFGMSNNSPFDDAASAVHGEDSDATNPRYTLTLLPLNWTPSSKWNKVYDANMDTVRFIIQSLTVTLTTHFNVIAESFPTATKPLSFAALEDITAVRVNQPNSCCARDLAT